MEEHFNPVQFSISCTIAAFIFLVALFLAVRSAMLRDDQSRQVTLNWSEVPYSLAKTQLLFWSVILINTMLIYWGQTGHLPQIDNDPNYLILLGISAGTTLSGKLIDNSDIAENRSRHQELHKSYGFITDILSDANGLSVHRFQAVVFTAIFGFTFLVEFFKKTNEFPSISQQQLVLMGISSSTYIALKFNENQQRKSASTDDVLSATGPDFTNYTVS